MLTLLSTVQVYSQSVDSTQTQIDKKMVKAITNEKGDAVFVFQDGREAQLFYGPNSSMIGQIKLQQVENTCGYEMKPANCVVEGYFLNMKFQLEWTKHSDPQKIGQVVERVSLNSEDSEPEKIESDRFLTDITYQKMFNNKPQDFPKYKLKCDQTEWIKNINESHKKVMFSSITAESMIENFETRVNENQTIAEIYNAQFNLISDNTYELSNYKHSSSMFSSQDPFISDQVVHFVYEKNKQVCHVAFAANITDILTKLDEMRGSQNEIKNKKLLRQVGNFSDNEVFFSIQDLLRISIDDKSTRYQ